MFRERYYSSEELFNAVPSIDKCRVLDVASGISGRFWKAYRQVLRQKVSDTCVVDDILKENVIATDEFFHSGMLFETPNQIMASDARDLPFKENEFDIVTIGYLFDLLTFEGQTKTVSEAYRVLTPGGSLIGDVILLRWRPSYGCMGLSDDEWEKRLRILKFMDKKGFASQTVGYRERILQAGFDIKTDGIGHTHDTKAKFLAYYFVAEKPL